MATPPPADDAPILLLAAVERELAPTRALLADVATHRFEMRITGVGKIATAIAAERAIAEVAPRWVCHIGCAGAFASTGLGVGDVVIGDEEVAGDEGFDTPEGFLDLSSLGFSLATRDDERLIDRVPLEAPDASVLERIRRRVAAEHRVEVGRLLTVSTGSGTTESARRSEQRHRPLAESLEGAASAVAAWTRRIPFREVRGIANLVGPRDPGDWDIDLACRNAARVLKTWIEEESR